jgi:hypothetical protein
VFDLSMTSAQLANQLVEILSPKESNEWPCGKCTYLNNAARVNCEMCDHPAHAPKAASVEDMLGTTATAEESKGPKGAAVSTPTSVTALAADGTEYALGEFQETQMDGLHILQLKMELAKISDMAANCQTFYLMDDKRDDKDDLELRNHETLREVREYAATQTTTLQFAVMVALGKEFTFNELEKSGGRGKPHSFDTNGLLYYLGTIGGTQPYNNPDLHGPPNDEWKVVAAMSSGNTRTGFRNPTFFVMHSHDGGQRNNIQDGLKWMGVDLGKERTFIPSHYCLRHGEDDSSNRLTNWRFEGSNDGFGCDEANWIVLKKHTNDNLLPAEGFSVASWAVEGVTQACRYFRIVQEQHAPGSGHMCICGFELYGVLRDSSL